jgi:predicted DsbA family dithiol-disulfide isomerase
VTGNSRLTIGIYFDLICPWCFIGKRRLETARDRFAQAQPQIVVESVWYSMQLLPEVPEQGLPFAEFYERRLGSPEAVQQRMQQVALAARTVGLDLDLARIARMPNTARAHDLLRRVATLGEPEMYEALLERLFAAYFQRGEDIGDAATLRALAAEVGVPADRLAVAMPGGESQAPAKDAVAGVPYFVFNGRLNLSGAHDPTTLLLAMGQAVRTPIAIERACA